jgi:hypothetical protein
VSFADAYLLKAGLRKALVEPAPHPELLISVTIPVHNESGLEECLDSLFRCGCNDAESGLNAESGLTAESDLTAESSLAAESDLAAESGLAAESDLTVKPTGFHAEVLIHINAPADAPPEILAQNHATLKEVRRWIASHPHPCIDFHVWLDHSFSRKQAGVGTARKILMDEAVRRFALLDRPDGIIAAMDADAVVERNYLEALVGHFKSGGAAAGRAAVGRAAAGRAAAGRAACDGCSIRFEHPLSAQEYGGREVFTPEVYVAIAQYELHLRYYLQSLRSTLYPFAFHTVGSSMAVRADVYCMEGGMNRRQAGEDFYFIQKFAQRGTFSECNTTCVRPSPRPSDRVPFGTGRAVSQLVEGSAPLTTYHPEPFRMLRTLFEGLDELYEGMEDTVDFIPGSGSLLYDFLKTQSFSAALAEIRSNSASLPAFRKRFWRWFSMFRIMKFLHFARERGYEDIPVEEAAMHFLKLEKTETLEQLLRRFRELDRSGIYP